MKEIRFTDIENFRIGNAENVPGGTGCTVIICEKGAVGGVSVQGGGPAGRETELLKPEKMCNEIYGIVLSGGSAYGLDACSGVMKYLEEKGIGFNVGIGVVPIVPGACVYDLCIADFNCRPDREMGYEAALNSEKPELFKAGNHGGGTGATVGKYLGLEHLMKGGLGTYAVQIGDLKVGAAVICNALGDIFDVDTGKKLAGLRTGLTSQVMWDSIDIQKNVFTGNTTICCVVTNAALSKPQCNKLAEMCHDGFARAIRPVHTSCDGDTLFFLSKGNVEVNQDALGDLASYVVAKAINDAVLKAESAYGIPAAGDMGR